MEEAITAGIEFIQTQGLAVFLVGWGIWFISQRFYPDVKAGAGALFSLALRATDAAERIADKFEGK